MIKVLIVDDSPFIRIALRKVLSSAPDIEVVGEASNGKEAIRLTEALRPDVVTLDINMPVMDGLEALGEIVRRCPECRVLMVSALTKEGARETIEALNRGALDFITKPSDYKDLFAFKEEIIGKISSRGDLHRGTPDPQLRSVQTSRRLPLSGACSHPHARHLHRHLRATSGRPVQASCEGSSGGRGYRGGKGVYFQRKGAHDTPG